MKPGTWSAGLAACGLMLATCAGGVLAQGAAWPAKPVRLIVGFPPGGAADIVGRIVAERLGPALGQQVVVDNRGGASGTIGGDAIAKAPADGYTIGLQSTSPFTYAIHVFGPRLPYDPLRDFALICRIAVFPLVMAVHPSLPARSVKELIALARAHPGKLTFASFGVGSSSHVGGELFKYLTKTDLIHVPYKGSGPAHVDLLGGHVQMMVDTVLAINGHVRSGRLRGLAVAGPRRASMLPDVPTIAEAGLPGAEVDAWVGVVGPAGMPPAIVGRLSQEVIRLLGEPQTRSRLAEQGAEVLAEPPEVFAQKAREDIAAFAKLVKEAKLRFD